MMRHKQNTSSEISVNLKILLDEAVKYHLGIRDWREFRCWLMARLPNEERKQFKNGVRPDGKLSIFEKAIVDYWRQLTGIEMIVIPREL